MKKIFKLFLIFILLIFLVSCGHENIRYINIPTASTTGTLYPFGNTLAVLWNKNIPGIKANVQASNGGIDNLNLLEKEEADISMAVSSNVYQSYMGLEKFEGRPNKKIRVIAGLYFNPNQIVVSNYEDINSLEDLKGKRFAPGAPGSTTEDEASIHFDFAGLNYPEDLENQYVSFTESIDLMRNNQIDGAWIMAGAPTSAVTEMLKTTDTKILEISEEFVDELKKEYPWYSSYKIKAGTYEEVDKDLNTTAIKMVMFTSEDTEDELVYELTKVFFENLEELKKTNNFLKDVNLEDAVKDIADLPIHEGAKRYYREKNVIK